LNLDRTGQLEKTSLGRQVQQKLREDILFGRLPPGELLRQENLCQEFGISRMPVRDALRSLVSEGLVRRTETGRLVVAELTSQDLDDMFHVEAVLHAFAARRATVRASEQEVAQLADLDAGMVRAADDGDSATMANLNWQFHFCINHFARSSKLIAALRAVSLNIHREFLMEFPSWMSHSNEQHAGILRAIHTKRELVAEKRMYTHVRESGVQILQMLERGRAQVRDSPGTDSATGGS
jgi:DNA-binding GntR family transcriptional regulator